MQPKLWHEPNVYITYTKLEVTVAEERLGSLYCEQSGIWI